MKYLIPLILLVLFSCGTSAPKKETYTTLYLKLEDETFFIKQEVNNHSMHDGTDLTLVENTVTVRDHNYTFSKGTKVSVAIEEMKKDLSDEQIYVILLKWQNKQYMIGNVCLIADDDVNLDDSVGFDSLKKVNKVDYDSFIIIAGVKPAQAPLVIELLNKHKIPNVIEGSSIAVHPDEMFRAMKLLKDNGIGGVYFERGREEVEEGAINISGSKDVVKVKATRDFKLQKVVLEIASKVDREVRGTITVSSKTDKRVHKFSVQKNARTDISIVSNIPLAHKLREDIKIHIAVEPTDK